MITNNLPKGILLQDDAQDLPIVNYNDANSPWKGPWTYTGGTQNTGAQSPDNNVSVSTKYARSGSASYRHYIKYTGNNDGQWGRGEWGYLKPSDQTVNNTWYWASISTLIDPSHAFESRRYQIAYDHKESPDDMETPFYLAIVGYNGDGKNGPRYALFGRFVGENDQYGRGFYDLGPVVTGVWVDWALNRNWSTGSDGYMKFYKNQQLVWSMNGPNRDSRGGSAPICRIQHGFYKWAWYDGNPEGSGSGNTTGDLLMYTDEIKFGNQNATLETMSPGNIAPTPSTSTTTRTPTFTTTTTLPPAGSIYINSGGPAIGVWSADKYVAGGTLYSAANVISGTNTPEIYQTERWGNIRYTIPVTPGRNLVLLHFAEIFWNRTGLRQFNVKIGGVQVLTNYDIYADVGSNKAVIKSFEVITDGTLSIEFISIPGKDNAKISAIEVVPAGGPIPTTTSTTTRRPTTTSTTTKTPTTTSTTTADPNIYIKSAIVGSRVINGVSRIIVTITYIDGSIEVITKKD